MDALLGFALLCIQAFFLGILSPDYNTANAFL
jgi:hypothetical protein